MPTYLDKIEAMRSLPANWDSYGADPANPRTLRDAEAFLRRFIGSLGLDEPQVVPTRVGGVCALWIVNGNELEVEFEPRGEETLVTFVFEDATRAVIKGEFTIASASDIVPIGLHALGRALADSGHRVAV